MGRVCAAVAWVLVAWACVGVGGVELVEGGYQDLVIALHPQMEKDADGEVVLQSLPSVVEEMGRALVTSTAGQLWLGSVRVVMPHWWNVTDSIPLTQTQENFSWRSADIRLLKALDTSDTYIPTTLQAGQCGVPGHYITIHTTFLDPTYASAHYGPQGHVLMHEWAHYRWGAWEEYGYPADTVYPVSFLDQDQRIAPTACHQGPLEGKYETSAGVSCTPDGSNKCYFFPDSQSNASTTKASLMSLTHLSEGTFCDETSHQPWAPTPQNLLCGRRSLWELLRTHPDFQNTAQGTTPSQPEITYHKAPQARVFFLFDAPSSPAQAESVNAFVKNVVTKNVELYGSLQLGLATFRTDAEGQMEIIKELPFTPVNVSGNCPSLQSATGSCLRYSQYRVILQVMHRPRLEDGYIIYSYLNTSRNPASSRGRCITWRITLYREYLRQLPAADCRLGAVSTNNFSSLASLLPDASDRLQENTMPLGDALMSVVSPWQRYAPGTLLLALAWNTASSDQVQRIESDTLLDKRVKLLALGPDGDLGRLVNLMPVLQDSGGRLYGSTTEINEDLDKYLRQHTFDDHKLYSSSSVVVPSAAKTKLEVITLQNHLVKRVNGFMHMTPFNPSEIEVFIFHPMIFVEVSCEQAANMDSFEFYCVNSESGVFVYFPTSAAVDLAAEYQLSVKNTGAAEVEVTVTWSVVEEDATNPQVLVDVWSSEDAGVRANISEANNIILFCQISHPRGVVEDVAVEAEVELDDGKGVRIQTLTLADDGAGAVDVRARDGVWSAAVSGSWSDGTSLTVTRLSIQQQSKTSFLNPDDAPHRSSGSEERTRVGGSSVLPQDPTEGSCCGSYAEGNSVKPVVINQILRRPYSTRLTRNVEEVPPRVVGTNMDPSLPPTVAGDTVEVLLSWTGVAQREAATTEQYMIRYHTTLSELRDNFESALQPLGGSDQAPASATSTTVVLPYNPGDPDLYVAVAYVNSESVVGPPSPPVVVKISDITVPTTPSTTPANTATSSVATVPTTTAPSASDPTTTAPSATDPTTTAPTDTNPTTIATETTTLGAATATVSFSCLVLVLLVMLRPSPH